MKDIENLIGVIIIIVLLIVLMIIISCVAFYYIDAQKENDIINKLINESKKSNNDFELIIGYERYSIKHINNKIIIKKDM